MAFYCKQRDLNEVKYVLRDQAEKISRLTEIINMVVQPSDNSMSVSHDRLADTDSSGTPYNDQRRQLAEDGRLKEKLRLAGTLLYQLVRESRQLEAERQFLKDENVRLNERLTVLERTVLERTVLERTVLERTVPERTVPERTVTLTPSAASTTEMLKLANCSFVPHFGVPSTPCCSKPTVSVEPLSSASNESVWNLLFGDGLK